MRAKELLEMIKKGESSTLEFKRKISSYEKIAREITAFANTIGGYLLIGVDDNGYIYGVSSEKSLIEQIQTACDFYIEPPVSPDIEIIELYGEDVIVCYISESEKIPLLLINPNDEKSKPVVYIRVGEKCQLASKEMKRVLAATNADAAPIRIVIGEKEKILFRYLDKHERSTVKDFARLVNISNRRAERLMVRLVKTGVLQIHVDSAHDYFTLVEKIR
jgi:predicted HTH transcriptional regulator